MPLVLNNNRGSVYNGRSSFTLQVQNKVVVVLGCSREELGLW